MKSITESVVGRCAFKRQKQQLEMKKQKKSFVGLFKNELECIKFTVYSYAIYILM